MTAINVNLINATVSVGAFNKQIITTFFHSRIVQHLEIIRVFYLPTGTQENCFKKNIKSYIKTTVLM
jgi:hypothetical protein